MIYADELHRKGKITDLRASFKNIKHWLGRGLNVGVFEAKIFPIKYLLLNPISGRGVVFIHPSGFSGISPKPLKLRCWNFLTFPKTKLGTFPENFKFITLPGAAPEHWELGGPIREASHLGEDHDAAPVLRTANERDHVITYTKLLCILFWHVFAIIGGSRRPKRGVIFYLPT